MLDNLFKNKLMLEPLVLNALIHEIVVMDAKEEHVDHVTKVVVERKRAFRFRSYFEEAVAIC